MTEFEEMLIYKGKVLEVYQNAKLAYGIFRHNNTFWYQVRVKEGHFATNLSEIKTTDVEAWKNAYDNLKKEGEELPMSFEEKVRAMTGKEIVMAMINGLRNEHVIVSMETYGKYSNGKCYGCAAANAICEIADFRPSFADDFVFLDGINPIKVNSSRKFLDKFELAIDYLRMRDIVAYNTVACELGIEELPRLPKHLKTLETYNYKKELPAWEAWANTL